MNPGDPPTQEGAGLWAGDARSVLLMSSYSLNPYLRELRCELQRDRLVEIGVPSLRRAISRRGRDLADVVHLHWEGHWISRSSVARSVVGFFQLVLLLMVARVLSRRIVWTVHNLIAHDSRHPRLERAMQALLARIVHGITVHTASGRATVASHLMVAPARIAVVPHGTYPGGNGTHRSQRRGARFLMFGLIRPYKRVLEVVNAVSASGTGHLIVAGAVSDPAYEAALQRAAGATSRVELRLRRQTDEELEELFACSDLLLLGSVEQLASGSALLAASRGVPVLGRATGFLDDVFGSSYLRGDPTDPETIRRAAEFVTDPAFDDMTEAACRAARATTFGDMAHALRSLYDAR